MKKYKGKRIFEGYSIAKIHVYGLAKNEKKKESTGFANESARFVEARTKAMSDLDSLYESTLKSLGEHEASIFATHKLMAEDLDLEDMVMMKLNEGLACEDAVSEAGEELASMFESMDDEYMKARGNDAREVTGRIVKILSGASAFELTEPSIIICNDLPASELMQFNKDYLSGLVMVKGSANSHVSILTRMLEVTSLAAIEEFEVTEDLEGKLAIIDASKNQLIINPTDEEISKFVALKKEYDKSKEELKNFVGKETISHDGYKTKIYCNIASSMEASNAFKNDAEGVGLFRSEFIYLDAKDYPTEDEQFTHYKAALETMKGKEVIIRTLDIGADKKIDYFDLPEEENPALGYRSIRICKDRPELFLTQLQALYRASAYGHLSIMIPMIISLEEVLFVKDMVKLAKDNLKKRSIPFDDKVKVGIMIETPAAAVMTDVLAQHVDFFSIGTNDLSQYTLAIDRVNPSLSSSFNPHHPAILRLMKMTVENAHKHGIVAGICGELARDPELLPFFLKIGVDELSVSPAYVLSLRKRISELDIENVDPEKYLF